MGDPCKICGGNAGYFPGSITDGECGYHHAYIYPVCKKCKKKYDDRVTKKQIEITEKMEEDAIKIIKAGGILKQDIDECDC